MIDHKYDTEQERAVRDYNLAQETRVNEAACRTTTAHAGRIAFHVAAERDNISELISRIEALDRAEMEAHAALLAAFRQVAEILRETP